VTFTIEVKSCSVKCYILVGSLVTNCCYIVFGKSSSCYPP